MSERFLLARRSLRLYRFIVNGIVATAVNYVVLVACIEGLGWSSAGIASLAASACGISASFLGNRYFVFDGTGSKVVPQAGKFLALYVALALLQSAILMVWTDQLGLSYQSGFVLATAVQFCISYLGSRQIFRRRA
jgi:putative flippase GtrA